MDDWIDYYDSTHTIYASKLHRDLHFQIVAKDIISYISSPDAVVLDYACGEALSAVLLECTLAGMATCTLSHLTELQSSRHLIGTLTGRAAMPQVLIRVGEAPVLGEVPPMTPRRPLDDVLTFHRDTGG